MPLLEPFQLLADSIGYLGTPPLLLRDLHRRADRVADGVIGSGAEGYYSSFRDVTTTSP